MVGRRGKSQVWRAWAGSGVGIGWGAADQLLMAVQWSFFDHLCDGNVSLVGLGLDKIERIPPEPDVELTDADCRLPLATRAGPFWHYLGKAVAGRAAIVSSGKSSGVGPTANRFLRLMGSLMRQPPLPGPCRRSS